MDDVFVLAQFDIDCDWEGLPPVYRIYFNDELFAERTWHWTDAYLQENLQVLAPPGLYQVRVEPVGPNLAHFRVANHQIEIGPGHWIDRNTLEILGAS